MSIFVKFAIITLIFWDKEICWCKTSQRIFAPQSVCLFASMALSLSLSPDVASLPLTRWTYSSCSAVSSVCSRTEREKEPSRRRDQGSPALKLQCDTHTHTHTDDTGTIRTSVTERHRPCARAAHPLCAGKLLTVVYHTCKCIWMSLWKDW